jgi:hypothetical protein
LNEKGKKKNFQTFFEKNNVFKLQNTKCAPGILGVKGRGIQSPSQFVGINFQSLHNVHHQ